jgi:hypothetical protein
VILALIAFSPAQAQEQPDLDALAAKAAADSQVEKIKRHESPRDRFRWHTSEGERMGYCYSGSVRGLAAKEYEKLCCN